MIRIQVWYAYGVFVVFKWPLFKMCLLLGFCHFFSDIIVLTHVKMKMSQTEATNNALLMEAQAKEQKILQVRWSISAQAK
jgi:hypothetical protein